LESLHPPPPTTILHIIREGFPPVLEVPISWCSEEHELICWEIPLFAIYTYYRHHCIKATVGAQCCKLLTIVRARSCNLNLIANHIQFEDNFEHLNVKHTVLCNTTVLNITEYTIQYTVSVGTLQHVFFKHWYKGHWFVLPILVQYLWFFLRTVGTVYVGKNQVQHLHALYLYIKGQSHEKVCEIIFLNDRLGSN
jgi:hypothetical protein